MNKQQLSAGSGLQRPTVLLLGGTGRTGRRVLEQLLERGFAVRAIVRSKAKLPHDAAENPDLTVIEASLDSLSDGELAGYLVGCESVVSCLGHVTSFRGIFGAPRDLVTRTVARVCRQIEARQPTTPVKLVLMSSVSVHGDRGHDRRRGSFERAFLSLVRAAVPPAKDNQSAATFLLGEVGPKHAFVEWVVVRPDSLLDGDVSEYLLHEELSHSIFAPASTRMANVAHFMCELVTSPTLWAEWKGKLPVITDAGGGAPGRGAAGAGSSEKSTGA